MCRQIRYVCNPPQTNTTCLVSTKIIIYRNISINLLVEGQVSLMLRCIHWCRRGPSVVSGWDMVVGMGSTEARCHGLRR